MSPDADLWLMSLSLSQSKEMLTLKLTSWQDKCSDATNMPDGIVSMIEGVRTPVAMTPQPSPQTQRHSRVSPEPQTSPVVLQSYHVAKQEYLLADLEPKCLCL